MRKLWEALLWVLPLVTILSVPILAKYVVDLVVVPHLGLISEWIAGNRFFILWAALYIFVAVGFFVLVFPVGFLILVYNKRRFSHNVGVAGNLVAGKPGVGPPVIRGAAIIARTKIEVPPDQPLDYHWEGHGFQVHIPAGAIVGERGPVTLCIQASLSGDYQLPVDGVLVSGVYWLSLHPHVEKFKKKVTITIQHCASDADSELAFVTAKCTQAMLPYTFKTLSSDHSDAKHKVLPYTFKTLSSDHSDAKHKVQPYTSKSLSEGSFSNSREGTIEVDHFSAFAIFSFLRLRKNYAFCTYYIQKRLNCYEAHITVTPDLALQMKVGGMVNKFLI